MNITDKKADIIKTLNQTNDEGLIDEVYALVHDKNEPEEINIDALPSDLQIKLARAINDYKSGNYISHAEMIASAAHRSNSSGE